MINKTAQFFCVLYDCRHTGIKLKLNTFVPSLNMGAGSHCDDSQKWRPQMAAVFLVKWAQCHEINHVFQDDLALTRILMPSFNQSVLID